MDVKSEGEVGGRSGGLLRVIALGFFVVDTGLPFAFLNQVILKIVKLTMNAAPT